MIKSELIAILAKKQFNMTERDVAESVNLVLDMISEALSQHIRVEIRRFGSFSLNHLDKRKTRNPKTGQSLETSPKYRPHFKPGKELRERVDRHIQEEK